LGKLEMLEVACHRCDRRGRLGLAHLIAEQGAGIGLLRTILAGDCARARAVTINDCCGVHFPQLPSLFLPSPAKTAAYYWGRILQPCPCGLGFRLIIARVRPYR
jgi:hypothetical protein